MRRILTALIALSVIPLLLGSRDFAGISSAQRSYCASPLEAEVLVLINAHREQHDLGPLALSQPLGDAATMKSNDMADRDYFSHTAPDGREMRDVLDDVGYPDTNVSYGENIAAGYPDAVSVFEAWRDSPTHNANMLRESFYAIGISAVFKADTRYGIYWTTMFGSQVVVPAQSCSGSVPPTPTVVVPTSTSVAPTPTIVAPTSTTVAPPPSVIEPTSTSVVPPTTEPDTSLLEVDSHTPPPDPPNPGSDPPADDFVSQLIAALKRILNQILGG